ncbi:ABC transporter substrate-binding protein [Paenibacillus motobuensis]|uniref:ABC transporter substrate-binding protein n=2 Tax=Paenibacillus motobuensis TaxID=295324 RepID=A0ABP3HSK8_9BACL
MRNKWIQKFVLLAMVGLLLAGCTSGPGKNDVKTPMTVKVMYYSEDSFNQTYGDLFSIQNENIEIELVNTQKMYNDGGIEDYEKALQDFIDQEQPDVLMLDMGTYSKMASEGKLTELDSLIERDKYNIESIYPALIDILKEKGEGKLYGLVPTFHRNVIFYNADLFAEHGIEPPHDGMTWQDIIDTARRFPTDGDEDARVYGFGRDSYGGMTLDNMASTIASPQGLKVVNPDTLKVTVNTDAWKQVFKLAQDALASDAFYNPKEDSFRGGTMEEYYKSQLFLTGRMAMTINSAYYLRELKEIKNRLPDYKPFQVGIAAGPVDPANPEISRDVYLGNIFAIRANSPNADAAWELIKFINGEQYAKIKSRSMNDGLLSRMGMTKEYGGINLDAFYKLKPQIDDSASSVEDKIPAEFYSQYYSIYSREIGLVESKEKSVDEALKTIEEEAQVALDQALKDKAAKDSSKAGTPESTDSNEEHLSTDGDAVISVESGASN